jgi:predicted branched-subunit amino acid permease
MDIQTILGIDSDVRNGFGAAERIGDARARAWGDVSPSAVAVIPFAIAIDATAADAEVHPVAGLAGAVLIIAGSAQLAALGLIDSGAGIAVAAGIALMINLRFVLYSARLSHWFADEPRWLRLLLAIPLVDQTFLICERCFIDVDDRVW